MRVLVLTNMFPHPGDPARGAFVSAQVDGLRDLGLAVEVLHIRGDRNMLNYARAVGQVRRAVLAHRADVVYAFYGLSGWVALWQSLPIVLSLAGDDILGTPNGRGGTTLKSRIGVLLSQWAAARASVVCVQSDEMKSRLWGRGLRDRALVLPYGVDPRRFSPGARDEARSRLGIAGDELMVMFPNTPSEPRKRIDLAEMAMEVVRKTYPKAVLRVVTRVPHATMPDYYRAADCCLLTSDWEGSPNVVKEALLSGVPVVSTPVGDVARWIPMSPESAIVERTPQAIAEAITKVLGSGRRVDPTPFVSAFGSRAIAERMVQLFERTVDSRPGPA